MSDESLDTLIQKSFLKYAGLELRGLAPGIFYAVVSLKCNDRSRKLNALGI